MEEKDLKTSPKQRFWIILIAVVMIGSIIASYALIVASNNAAKQSSESSETTISDEKIAEYENAYNEKVTELGALSADDFNKFVSYKSEVSAYNETAANEGGVKTRDIVEGSGDAVSTDTPNYLAYYIGWCADESIFDSSFNDNDNPTSFAMVLDPSAGMIEGWNTGVEGMKLGGIREITIPGELAYGDSMEICGGTNKPLKFLVMPVDNKDPLSTLATEISLAYMKLQYAYYGIDYDALITTSE